MMSLKQIVFVTKFFISFIRVHQNKHEFVTEFVIQVSNESFRLEKAGDYGELDIPSNETHIIECSKACLVVLYCKGTFFDASKPSKLCL